MDWLSTILGGITLMISSIIFVLLYRKVGIAKWINKKNSRGFFVILTAFILYLSTMSIIRSITNLDRIYYDIVQGLILGVFLGIIICVINKNNI